MNYFQRRKLRKILKSEELLQKAESNDLTMSDFLNLNTNKYEELIKYSRLRNLDDVGNIDFSFILTIAADTESKKLLKDRVLSNVDYDTSAEEIMNFIYDGVANLIETERFKTYGDITISRSEDFKERYPDMVLDHSKIDESSYFNVEHYYEKRLGASDIVYNIDAFIDKKVLFAFRDESSYSPKQSYVELKKATSDEEIQYFLKGIKPFFDVSKRLLNTTFADEISDDRAFLRAVSAYSKATTDKEKGEIIFNLISASSYLKHSIFNAKPSFDDLKELSKVIPMNLIFKDYLVEAMEKYPIELLEKLVNKPVDLRRELVYIIDEYGINNVVKYNQLWNGFFVKKSKELYENYFQYGRNVHDPDKTFFTKTFLEKREYTEEEFFESIRRMIIYGSTNVQNKNPFDYRLISGSFRDANPDLFLDPLAPGELQENFYAKRLTPKMLFEHPEYIKFLVGKNLESSFENLFINLSERGKDSFGETVNAYVFILKKFGFEDGLRFISEYGENFEKAFTPWEYKQEEWLVLLKMYEEDTCEEIRERIDSKFFELISNTTMPFSEHFPKEFKIKYSQLFLPENTPQEIKDKFYKKKISSKDLIEGKIDFKYFEEIDMKLGYDQDLSWISTFYSAKVPNDKLLDVLRECEKIENISIKKAFKEYIKKNYEKIEKEKLDSVGELLHRIAYSNSSEILNFKEQIAAQILSTDDPIKNFSVVEGIFLRNNLPVVGKVFSVFDVLNLKKDNLSIYRGGNLSPTLKGYSDSNKSIIIFSDLLRISSGSNNRSLKNYIDNIEKGDIIFQSIISGDVSVDNLDSENKKTLSIYVSHLHTLYKNTFSGSRTVSKPLSGDLIQDAKELYRLFSVEEVDVGTLPDRVVKMFSHFSGFNSLEQLKKYMDYKVNFADKKNRLASKQPFVLEKGDFVKGINNVSYLGSILQNGSVAKEFLGASAASDCTPLDTDLSKIEEIGQTPDETISKLLANDYGSTWLVLKNDDRFINTREVDSSKEVALKPSQLSKIEVFRTGERDHHGIRTGFASSEIDYIVTDENVSKIGFEIAVNGFYIPVVEKKTGKIVFSEKDYDDLRNKMNGLSYYGLSEYAFSESISTPETEFLARELKEYGQEEAKVKRDAIADVVGKPLIELGLQMKNEISDDLTEGSFEFIDTGSTGRGTNIPNDSDFDFVLRLDKKVIEDSEKMHEIKKAILEALGKGNETEVTKQGDFRLEDVSVGSLDEPVKVDITFLTKTDKVIYSTDMALKDKLNSIKDESIDNYYLVLANILLAKKELKEAKVYKAAKSDSSQGGFGGVGVENWILQNGGSFDQAARDFLEHAKGKNFEQFKKEYHVWDFGENHLSEKKGIYPHDDFVNNMSSNGYEKMKKALSEKLQKEQGNSFDKEEVVNTVTGVRI